MRLLIHKCMLRALSKNNIAARCEEQKHGDGPDFVKSFDDAMLHVEMRVAAHKAFYPSLLFLAKHACEMLIKSKREMLEWGNSE